MKSRYIGFAALLSVALFAACTPSHNQPEEGGAAAFSLRLEGDGLGGIALRSNVGTLRVVSSSNDYNQLATKEGEGFKFTLPTRNKQTLFFVANEKTDLASLKASTFNQTPLKTADYFLNHGQDDPKLYTETQQMEHNTSGGEIPLKLHPAYAKLTYEIQGLVGGTTLKSLVLKNVPAHFTLGGVETHYPANDTDYTQFSLPIHLSSSEELYKGSCYLPEHDPADINRRTFIEMTLEDGKVYRAVVKEPYNSVDDGKIVRGKHYKLTISIPREGRGGATSSQIFSHTR